MKRIDRYGVMRALPWLLIELVILTVLAVPVYVALQFVLSAIWSAW